MALSQSKLEAVFLGSNAATESEALDFMAVQFTAFFADATVATAPAVLAALSTPEAQFRAALVGMSSLGQGAARLQAAISAFWVSAMTLAPTIWPTTVPIIVPASGIIPPSLGTISAALSSVFASNLASNASQAVASAALGAALMPTQLGATVTLAPPPPGGTPLIPVL